MSACLQLLRKNEHTKAHRHTGSVLYQVAKGKGYSIINGQRFDWEEHDIFCVPTWMFHEHVNANPSEDACLFSFNDMPVMNSLGIYREEALFCILQADHDLAVNSVDERKAERVEAGIRSFNTFADAFPQSARLAQARALLRDLTSQQKRSQRTSNP